MPDEILTRAPPADYAVSHTYTREDERDLDQILDASEVEAALIVVGLLLLIVAIAVFGYWLAGWF